MPTAVLLLLLLFSPACTSEPNWSWRNAPGNAPPAVPSTRDPGTAEPSVALQPAGPRRELPPGPPTYRYGAKFEPPDGRILHGMGQWLDGNRNYVEALDDPALAPAAALYFMHLGDWVRPWEAFLDTGYEMFRTHVDEGRMLHLSLGLYGLDQQLRRKVAIDRDLARPSRYDEHVRDVAILVRKLGVPTFVRIGYEFNGPWNGYSPGYYPLAFRRIVEIFREEGVRNAAFVWCWEASSPADFDELDEGAWRWYPGDDVVDWFGLDLFKATNFTPQTPGRSVSSGFPDTLRFLAMAEKHRKPVMVAESSASMVEITAQEADGRRDWTAWFEPFFAFLAANPAIKAFHYINHDWKGSTAAESNGWKDADISHNAWLARRYANEMRDPLYLHVGELPLLLGWSAAPRGAVEPAAGIRTR
ncbi:MAG: hypothetical protein FJ296_09700 [Planctomycetes bacterium]|nr:hypothetical protein [Planctomycetota bacterium]